MEMMNILVTAMNAILPIVLLILLGYCLRLAGFLNENFVQIGSKLGFNVLVPCMLFVNVYSIESFSSIRWDIVVYSVVMVCVIFLLGLVSAILTTKIPERRGVLLQCTFRSNVAIIGVSLASTLGGSDAIAVASIVTAFTLPFFNVFAVIALSMFSGNSVGQKDRLKSVLLNIAKNPLIIAIVLGMGCLLIRSYQIERYGRVVFALNRELKFLYTALNNIKSTASPFALIVLGGQFEFSAAKNLTKEILVGTLWRVVLAPLIGIGTAVLLSTYTGILSCGPNEYPVLVALFGSPVAVSSAVMAGQMGGDEQLASQLVVWTSLASIATIFLSVCVMTQAGLLAI